MASSKFVPLTLLGTAVAIAALNAIGLAVWQVYLPKLLVAVPLCIFVGIAMLAFPGAEAPPGTAGAEMARHYWRAAPRSRQAIWIVAGVMGLVIGVYAIGHLGYFAR